MASRFGYELVDWEAAKEQARLSLIECAKAGVPITYADLVRHITAIAVEAHSYALGHLLGEISLAEDAAGRGMLSVLVVHKDGDMQPGSGFFDLAKRLGRDTSDVMQCWLNEYRRVHDYWSRMRSDGLVASGN